MAESVSDAIKDKDTKTYIQLKQEPTTGDASTRTINPNTRKRSFSIRESTAKKRKTNSGEVLKDDEFRKGFRSQQQPSDGTNSTSMAEPAARERPTHGNSDKKTKRESVKVDLPKIDIHNRYKHFSQKLFEVLEVVGANDQMRQHQRRYCLYDETAFVLRWLPSSDGYFFGSSYEGTSTKAMYSDVDFAEIYNDIEVVTNLSEATSGDCLLLIQDDSTPPGYCKLQLVQNGVPAKKGDTGWQSKLQVLTNRIDKRNKLVCCYDGVGEELGHLRHGPAERRGYVDHVFALRCFSWPDRARKWLKRKRKHNWPSPNLIQICSTLGFLLVAVGHPYSSEQELQWRLSFSHQERLLVEQFNSVQFKCYIVLKYIKLEIQDNNINELFLSSYHLKTAMFYLIENTSSDCWIPENLISCVIAAWEMILRWIETDNCPNYFIPEENMFEGKTADETKTSLSEAIQQILSDFERTISQIQRDSLGQLMDSNPQSQIFQDKKADGRETSLHIVLLCIAQCLHSRNYSISKYYNKSKEDYISNLTQLQQTVRDKISQEQDTEKQTVWSVHLSFIQVSLLSNCVALDIQENRSKEDICKSLTCDSWKELHLKFDISKLKQASLMYMLEYNKDSLDNLASLKHEKRYSICMCREKIPSSPKPIDLVKAGISSDLTPEEFLRDIVSPCVVFLPNESNVTPIAIQYEMIRSFAMPLEAIMTMIKMTMNMMKLTMMLMMTVIMMMLMMTVIMMMLMMTVIMMMLIMTVIMMMLIMTVIMMMLIMTVILMMLMMTMIMMMLMMMMRAMHIIYREVIWEW